MTHRQENHHRVRCERLKRFLTETLPTDAMTHGLLTDQLPQPLAQHAATCQDCYQEVHQSAALAHALATYQSDLTPRFGPEHYAQRAIALAAHRATVPPQSTSRLGWAALGALAASLVLMLIGQLRQEEKASQHRLLSPSTTASRSHRAPQDRPQERQAQPQPNASTGAQPAQRPVQHRPSARPSPQAATTRHQGARVHKNAISRRRRHPGKTRRNRRYQQHKRPKWLALPKDTTPTFASGWHGFPLPPLPPEPSDTTTRQSTTVSAASNTIAPWPRHALPPPPPPLPALKRSGATQSAVTQKQPKSLRSSQPESTNQPPPPPPLPKGATDDPLLRKLLKSTKTQ